VRILEARDRIGGRAYSLRGGGWPIPVDLGAEFVQGHIPALLHLANEIGSPVVELSGTRRQLRAGKRGQNDAFYRQIEKVRAALPDLPPDQDQSFSQFLKEHAPGENGALIKSWVESYDAADTSLVSVRFLVREREAERVIQGDRAYRLVSGYDMIPRALYQRISSELCTLHLSTVVTDVEWSPGEVTVHTSAAAPFRARRLVISLPVGVLQSGSVHFHPRVDQMEVGLRGLEMGHVVKIAFAFKERFWEPILEDDVGFLMTADGPFRAWWTGYPVYAPTMIAWAGGPQASALAAFSLSQRVDAALDSLARALGTSRKMIDDQVVKWATHDWAADPFARGAYSYVRVGGIERQAQLATPVADTLFFAGEATETAGHQATVHGALFAGQRAADEVKASLVG